MTDPKKPASLLASAPAQDAPTRDLTPPELALVAAYRTMDERAKSEILEEAERKAVMWSRCPVRFCVLLAEAHHD
jgi:hypothetical protein